MTKKTKDSILRPIELANEIKQSKSERMFAEFIERMGISAQGDGLPRIAGRMMAWFVLNGGPISLTELAEALGVSKASASTNARMLASLGVLERAAKSEGRKDFWELSNDGYARLLEGYVYRMNERLEMIDDLLPAVPKSRPDVVGRVAQMRSFYDQAIQNTQNLVARLRKAQ